MAWQAKGIMNYTIILLIVGIYLFITIIDWLLVRHILISQDKAPDSSHFILTVIPVLNLATLIAFLFILCDDALKGNSKNISWTNFYKRFFRIKK